MLPSVFSQLAFRYPVLSFSNHFLPAVQGKNHSKTGGKKLVGGGVAILFLVLVAI